MNWKNNFKAGREIILATASGRGAPNANIVISLGFVDGKLLVADCQMRNTIRNLAANKRICVVGGYVRIYGRVKILSSGPHFDKCVRASRGYTVKHAILISIDKVFDLDQGKLIE